MGKVELELTVSSLLQYAKSAESKEQWYLAVQNLNDAYKIAASDEEIKKVFLAYADLFLAVNNAPLARYALFMAFKKDYKGGFEYIDFARFMPEQPLTVPVEEEEELISAEQTIAFNKVFTLICEKKYTEAIKLFYTLPFNRKNMASIVDALSVALSSDVKFDLDSYIVPLLPIIGEYASGDAEFINILLSGGENTKLLAVEGAKFFIEDNEDVDLLRDMGEVFFLASEFDTAKAFFEKVLSLCEIDEVSLYYMYAVSIALQDAEAAAKYRAKYLTVCFFAMPPMRLVDLCATTTKKNNVTEYLALDVDREHNLFQKLNEYAKVDEENFLAIKDFCVYGSQHLVITLLERLASSKEREPFDMLCNSLLESAFVGKDMKRSILDFFLHSRFDGVLSCNLPSKGLLCDVASFRHRYGKWNQVFYDVSSTIIGADFYLPYHSSMLMGVIKRCKEKIDEFDLEDMDFIYFVVLISYANRLNENISISDVASLVNLTPGVAEECLNKYNLDSPVL